MNLEPLTLAGWIALPLALGVTPWLMAGMLARGLRGAGRIAVAALCGVALNTLLPAALAWSSLPLSRGVLAGAHLVLVVGCAGLVRLMRRPATAGAADSSGRLEGSLLPVIAGLALVILVFPYTHFTGIDTYKWQDLAVVVQATEDIPWLVHPLSLLGFTPRAYPAAQPLMLASLYILGGGLHVRFAWYVLSLWTAGAALAGSLALGRRLFTRQSVAGVFAACYVLAPVFIRYSHWVTGRGLFLALFPVYLLALVELPRHRAWLGALVAAVVLLLTHKVAWVAVPLGLVSCVIGMLCEVVPGSGSDEAGRAEGPRRCLRAAVVLALLVPAALLTPRWGGAGFVGAAGGLLRYGLVRGNWLAPAALAALVSGYDGLRLAARRRFALLACCSVMLLFEPQMYGALVALPAMAALAAGGVQSIVLERISRRAIMQALLLGLLLAGAAVVVVHRNRLAATPRLVRAARFLQTHDPDGPFRIEAPGRARPLMQAYQTGSPRFTVTVNEDSRVQWIRPPMPSGGIAATIRSWSVWGRAMLEVEGSGTDWYGPAPRLYHVRIDGVGERPPGGVLIYAAEDIQIYRAP